MTLHPRTLESHIARAIKAAQEAAPGARVEVTVTASGDLRVVVTPPGHQAAPVNPADLVSMK